MTVHKSSTIACSLQATAFIPYRHRIETNAFADDGMLRNMLLKKYKFNLNSLLFKIKTTDSGLLLLEFIYCRCRSLLSSLGFKKKRIDFGDFPVYFRMSTSGFLSEVNRFDKFTYSINDFRSFFGKNPFRFKKKSFGSVEKRSVFAENLCEVMANSNGFFADPYGFITKAYGFTSMLRNMRMRKKALSRNVNCVS